MVRLDTRPLKCTVGQSFVPVRISTNKFLTGGTAMKALLLFGTLILPLAFVGTASGNGTNKGGVIVRVKNTDKSTGYLGVSIQDMTGRLAKAMDVKIDEGALVTEVIDDSPAEEAGIKEEDIIIEVDGTRITDADDLRSAIRTLKPETKVNLVVMRKDERKTFTATIAKQPHSGSYSYSFAAPALPHIPRAPRIQVFVSTDALGMALSPLNEQLGKYFEAPDGKGVLVNEVEEESKAEKAGFIAGDVIIRIGKETIEDVRDVHNALRDFKKGEKADVEIIRKGSKKTVTIEVPDMDRHRRSHYGFAPHGNWMKEFDFEVDPPDVELELEGHESLKNDLNRLRLELRDFGREIQTKVKRLQEELKAKFAQVIS
jgi:membrane-associated protease RseP (regulator of RpoE activity)